MTLARKCESCGALIRADTYYDVMVTPKVCADEPSQDAENSYGDFCEECLKNGKAITVLLKAFDETET